MIADKLIQRRADNGDDRPVAFHIHVDVSVEIGDVEQPFDVVGSYLALEFKLGHGRRVQLIRRWPVQPTGLRLVLVHARGSVSLLARCLLLGVREHVLTWAHSQILLVDADIRMSAKPWTYGSALPRPLAA